METATLENLRNIKAKMETENIFPPHNAEERLKARSIIFTELTDYEIPSSLDSVLMSFTFACYDKTGTGYGGITSEIKYRISHYRKNGQICIIEDFFKCTHNADFISNDGKSHEIKTGCGAWLYSFSSDLNTVRKQYEQRNEILHWHYIYRRKETDSKSFSFRIDIDCTWFDFFRFLDTYDNGYETFFKYNKKKSEEIQRCIFEMNTLCTSKKKVKFLRTFSAWYQDNGKTV